MTENQRIIPISENVLIVIHGIVLVLTIGQNFISLPVFLEVVGRMHPLLLHFPIVLLFLTGLLFWYPNWLGIQTKSALRFLFLASLVLTGLTVLAGLFLSAEGGYEEDLLFPHQWTGLGVFWTGTLWYFFWTKNKIQAAKFSSLFALALVLVAGHLGANITHGSDYLLAPLAKLEEKPEVPLEEALAFDHVIKPILEQKCISCHGPNKKKGELRLDEMEFFLTGGETGPALDNANWEKSLLLHRIFLPMEDEEHMPPKGKIQLTEQEIELLQAWVLDSARFDKKVNQYPQESNFFTLAKGLFDDKDRKTYDFPFADKGTIAKLNNEYRVIQVIYPDSPGLRVSFFGKSQFNANSLDELSKIKEQVVDLNLQNMPLKDADLNKLANFPNLETLNLNFTGINGSGLSSLTKLEHLQELSLSGNPLSEDAVSHLGKMQNLAELYVWNTQLPASQLTTLSASLPDTRVESGFEDDGRLYQLNAPVIESEKTIFQDKVQVTMKHPIGSVKVFYTLDNSTPDSSNHIVYEGPFFLEKSANLKARAFAQGWLGSPERQTVFLKSGIRPDKMNLTFPPNERYKGKGPETLFDLEKGDTEFTSGNWLGYKDTPFEITMEFDKPKDIENIAFSLFSAEGSYIFPPAKVEIWIADAGGNFQLLSSESPEMPTQIRESQLFLKEYPIQKSQVRKIKARLSPINPLPKWHPGAGQRGWVFVDEILIN